VATQSRLSALITFPHTVARSIRNTEIDKAHISRTPASAQPIEMTVTKVNAKARSGRKR
jgi:hypothetical protein